MEVIVDLTKDVVGSPLILRLGLPATSYSQHIK